MLSGFGFKKHINTSVESWTLILSPVVPHVGSQPPRLPYKPSMWIKNSDLNRREAWRTQATGTHTVQVCTGTSKYWLHITSKSCSDQTRLKIWYLPVPYLFPSLPTSICLTHFNLRIWTNQAVMSEAGKFHILFETTESFKAKIYGPGLVFCSPPTLWQKPLDHWGPGGLLEVNDPLMRRPQCHHLEFVVYEIRP